MTQEPAGRSQPQRLTRISHHRATASRSARPGGPCARMPAFPDGMTPIAIHLAGYLARAAGHRAVTMHGSSAASGGSHETRQWLRVVRPLAPRAGARKGRSGTRRHHTFDGPPHRVKTPGLGTGGRSCSSVCRNRVGRRSPDRQFAAFLQDVVAPRFPAGFTVLEGRGQFRDRHGTLVQEDARIVVLLYDPLDRTAGARIDAIRRAYAQAFRQESVLRADGTACVFF